MDAIDHRRKLQYHRLLSMFALQRVVCLSVCIVGDSPSFLTSLGNKNSFGAAYRQIMKLVKSLKHPDTLAHRRPPDDPGCRERSFNIPPILLYPHGHIDV